MMNETELRSRWEQRLLSGRFSAGVQGLGTIRVMGRAGDAPIQFPRIESLDALGQLEPDEQWAVRMAEAIVTEARERQRPVLAAQPPQPGQAPRPVLVATFDQNLENIVIASMITGG